MYIMYMYIHTLTHTIIYMDVTCNNICNTANKLLINYFNMSI